MPDDLQRQDPDAKARTQVHMDEPDDVRYWTERFGVTEEELRNAVGQAGSSAEAVAKHLEKNWLP